MKEVCGGTRPRRPIRMKARATPFVFARGRRCDGCWADGNVVYAVRLGARTRMSQGGDGSGKPGRLGGSGGRSVIRWFVDLAASFVAVLVALLITMTELIEQRRGLAAVGIRLEVQRIMLVSLILSLCFGERRGGYPGRSPVRRGKRVRKEKARLAALEGGIEAEGAFQRARDPRQNMPSRFTGSFPAPLSDRQPPRDRCPPAVSSAKAMAAEARGGLTVMPGGPVLTGRAGGIASGLSRSQSSSRENPSICVCSLVPGDASALGPAGIQRGAANPGDEEASEDALRLVETRAGRQSKQSCRQGMEKETWKIMRTAGASPY